MDSPELDASARLNRRISLESLSLQGSITWVMTFVVQLRSLELSLDDYNSLPMLLTNYSNTLTSLSLDIEIRNLRMSPLDVFN